MKKILVAIASVLALGIFASCQNGAQDVNVTGNNSWDYNYKAEVSGKYTDAKTTVSATTGKDVDDSKTYDVSGTGSISWTEGSDTNYTDFTLEATLWYKATAAATTYTREDFSKTVTKIDDKYYINVTDYTTGKESPTAITIDGELDDDEFTITIPSQVVIDDTLGELGTDDGYVLKFVRK